MERRLNPFAANWGAALAVVMNALGGPRRFRSAHAPGGTPSRQRNGYGRSRWEGHRIRKAKRLEPVAKVPG